MAYEYWMFNNIPIEKVIKSNYNVSNGTITLTCFADCDGINDCRTVIAGWRMYESLEKSRTKSMGGTTNLQTSRAGTFLLTNALQNFEAVLTKVTSTIDEYFNDEIKPLLIFDLEFTVGNVVFYDLYGKKYLPDTVYTNLDYKPYLDSTDEGVTTLGEDLGQVIITETKPSSHLNIYGYAASLPSYVEVNGVRKYWHYTGSDGVEKLIWDLPANTTVITIRSPRYLSPVGLYGGSVITAICTFPNENLDIFNIAYEGV